MRLIAIICLIFSFYTEGVSQKKDEIPFAVDSVIENSVELAEEDTASIQLNAQQAEAIEKMFRENQQKYESEDLKQRNFEKNDWQKATAGLDYTVDKKPQEQEKSYQGPSISPILGRVLVEFFKWFFIIGAILILALLIYRFVGEGNIFGKQSKRIYAPSVAIDLEKIEENLHDAELDPLIRQAINQKQYALAIRLYYLAIVKELSISNVIQWKKDKTNREYLREMRQSTLFEPFKSTTSIFEKVWYGDSALQESDFNILQPAFQDLLNRVRK